MYTKLPLSTANPGLILILLDQSGSMDEPYPDSENNYGKKMDFAAQAVNRCIYEVVAKCTEGNKIKDRCHIGVIGYGDGTRMLIGGTASEVDAQRVRTATVTKKVPDGAGGLVDQQFTQPVWVESRAANGTPMYDAFDQASEHIRAWVSENPNTFPPIVINITDGVPNDCDSNFDKTIPAAQRLTGLATADGATILLNAHIGEVNQREILLPADANLLPDQFGRMLYGISTTLPQPMIDSAQSVGFGPVPGARGIVMNARAESLIKLITFGSNVSQARR